jgi:hypothetical protein
MQTERYRVVFTGKLDQTKTIGEIETALTGLFKLTPSILKRVMAGRPIVVKNNIDAEMAILYKSKIDALGAFCRVEQVPEINDTDAQGYLERRKSDRRNSSNNRRKMRRTSSIQPDRRGKDRRKSVP